MPEWSKFKVGTPAHTGFNTACQAFDTIRHTSHITSALSILDNEKIRPYLVFDESKLNDQRILVSWLSPNQWGVGYRYGNVYFDFDFKSLIASKKFYWVESVAYKIPACRILVSDQNHNANLEPYDPTIPTGPWWHDTHSDKHYYNGTHCLEFMFEASVSLSNMRTFGFVDHHTMYCSLHRKNPGQCKELGFRAQRGGAMFIGRAVGSGFSLTRLSPHFVTPSGRPNSTLEFAFNELRHRVTQKVVFAGDLKAFSKEGAAVAKAICSALSFQQIDTAKQLASLFLTENDCDCALAIAVGETVGLSSWAHLVDA